MKPVQFEVQALTDAMERAMVRKDLATAKHHSRVAEVCLRIGKHLSLSDAELALLELSALLHDIGKLGVDDAILKSSQALNQGQWEQMRAHAEIGFRLLRGFEELPGVAEIVHAHHERWDGAGYPRRLKGAETPLLARVIAVADAFDAMVHGRPYRAAVSEALAAQEIMQHRGTQFDPDVVDAFVAGLNPVGLPVSVHATLWHGLMT